MQGQPYGRFVGIRPFDAMPSMRRDIDVVTGFHCQFLGLILEPQASAAPQQHDLFGSVLIVPFALGRRLARGDYPHQLEVSGREQSGEIFLGE